MGSATSIIKLSLQSNQYEQGLRGAKRQFEDFTASIGINMKKMTAFGLAAGAAASAINSMTSAISTAMTEGTRMAKEMEGVRAAFKRLDQPGLLGNLREATHGTVNDLELMKQAVKFDNFNLSLEQMGTMLAFAQQQAKDTGQDVGYLVDSIVTGLGRKSLPILDNLGLSATEIRERMKETGDMTKAVADIIQERMEAAGGYVETASDRASKATAELENAMTSLGETFAPLVGASDSLWNSIKIGAINALNTAVKPLIQALAEAGALGQGARATAGFGNLGGNSKVDRMIGRLGTGKTAGSYSIYQQQLGEFDKYINNKRFQIAAYGGDNSSVAQSAKTKLQTELDGALKMREEYVKRAQELHNQMPSPAAPASTSGSVTGKGGKGFDISSIAFNAPQVTPEQMIAPPSVWEQYAEGIRGTFDTIGDSMSNFTEWTANFDPYTEKMNEMTKAAKQQQMAMGLAANAVGSFSQALAGMDDPAAKAAGTVMQAIASIALGFATASAQANTAGTGWGWLAWIAAGMSAMATTIATVHSLTGYAEGGMIKGNSYSGDRIGGLVDGSQLVGLNAGEVVLNAAQQNNLAQSLQGNAPVVRVIGKISGTDIILSADRTLMTQGKQLAVWGM